MPKDDVSQHFEKLFTPKILRDNLMMVSLYLLAYEILRDTIIDQIKNFMSRDFIDGKPCPTQEYYEKVQALNQSPLQASCLWLQDNGALTEEDVELVGILRRHRNEISHDLPLFLSDPNRNVSMENIEKIRYIIRKVGV